MNPVRGFSLVEVLVAVVVLAIGLLGLSLMLAQSVRYSHVSATHRQVTHVAQSMIDRMSTNVQGVWLSDYEMPAPVEGLFGFSAQCSSAACTPAQLAERDILQWRAEIAQLLPPGATGRIRCTPLTAPPSPADLVRTPVYAGSCVITLTWSEHEVSDGEAAGKSLSWRFTP